MRFFRWNQRDVTIVNVLLAADKRLRARRRTSETTLINKIGYRLN